MPVVYPILQFRGLPTLFGHIRDTNVTFVIDTSENMQAYLNTVKYHLVEALLAMAYNRNYSRFNIVEFSNKITKWCDRLVTCSPPAIYSAMQWIQCLTCTLGRNLLGALTAAFHDPVCQAIYLVTNSLPDNELKDIFSEIPYISQSRPVHIVYLSDKWIDSEIREFLQRLAGLTQGSARLIRLNTSGDIKQVIPVYPADFSTSGPLYSDLKYCTVKRALDMNPYTDSWVKSSHPDTLHIHPLSMYNPHVTACIHKYGDPQGGSLGSTQLISGASVLARRESDGFYYRGTIKQEVWEGLFLVEFDKPTKVPSEKWQVFLQKVALRDIILYDEAMRHSVVPGDKVLAPWESDQTRYGPGIVIFGIETRDPLQVMEDNELAVEFWNGKSVKVPRNMAMWIPSALYERVQEELLTPLSSRQQLQLEELSTCHDVCPLRLQTLPFHLCHSEPTYIRSWYPGFPGLEPYNDYWHGFYRGFHSLPAHAVCDCFPEVISPFGWWTVTLRSTNPMAFDKEELDKKVTSQLQELDTPKKRIPAGNPLSSSSSTSLSEDSDSSSELNVIKPTLEDRAVNTDIKLFEKPKTKVEDRPEWKYWSQSHQEPHRKKPGTPSSSSKSCPISSQLISSRQLQDLGPTNRSAMFENIHRAHSQNRVTIKEVLTHRMHDITPSTKVQVPPIQERLGENQLPRDRQQQEAVQRSRKKKLQRRQWEKDREQQSEDKYQHVHEQRRGRVMQHLENQSKQIAECERKLEETGRVKRHLQQINQTRIQSIASEDKEREARRLAYHQQVTARNNSKVAEKVKAEEVKEIQQQEARRKRVELRNQIAAERFYEAERLTEERETGRRKHQIKRVSSF